MLVIKQVHMGHRHYITSDQHCLKYSSITKPSARLGLYVQYNYFQIAMNSSLLSCRLLNFHLFVRELFAQSMWLVRFSSLHLWIMHLTLRNFPVKGRQMAHTTTYWQVTKQTQRKRATRPNVGNTWSKQVKWWGNPLSVDSAMDDQCQHVIDDYVVVNGLSAPVCIRKKALAVGEASLVPAEQFQHQRRRRHQHSWRIHKAKKKRRSHAMSSAVLGEWHSHTRRLHVVIQLS